MLADAYRLFATYGMAPTSEVIPLARAAANRAPSLDPRQVEALQRSQTPRQYSTENGPRAERSRSVRWLSLRYMCAR